LLLRCIRCLGLHSRRLLLLLLLLLLLWCRQALHKSTGTKLN